MELPVEATSLRGEDEEMPAEPTSLRDGHADLFAGPVAFLAKPGGATPDQLKSVLSGQMLSPLDNPLARDHIIKPEIWRTAITKSIPWLWDLDLQKLEERDASRLPHYDAGWNWERHFRRLSEEHLEVFKQQLPGLAPGLQNRRRIWKLVEEMGENDLREAKAAIGRGDATVTLV